MSWLLGVLYNSIVYCPRQSVMARMSFTYKILLNPFLEPVVSTVTVTFMY